MTVQFERKIESEMPGPTHSEWSLSNAVIYAVSLSTTIGYNNVYPLTVEGKSKLNHLINLKDGFNF